MILGSIFEILYLPELVNTEEGVSVAVQKLVVLKILPITLSIALLKGVWSYFKENKHMGIDIEELARLFLLGLLLSLYNPAINLFSDVVHGIAAEYEYKNAELNKEVVINQMMHRAQEQMPNLSGKEIISLKESLSGNPKKDAEFLADQKAKYDAARGDGNSSWGFSELGSAILNLGGRLNNMATNWMMTGVTGFVGKGGMMIAQSVMWVVIIVFGMVLRCLGPLAIGMSFIFPGQLKTWFSTFAAAKCSIITTMVIESLAAGLMMAFHSDAMISTMGLDAIDKTNPMYNMLYSNLILGINLTLFLTYVMVFFFTSKWIGGGDGGQFLSKAAGLAMTGVSAGMKGIQSAMKSMASKGASGGGSGSEGGNVSGGPTVGG